MSVCVCVVSVSVGGSCLYVQVELEEPLPVT